MKYFLSAITLIFYTSTALSGEPNWVQLGETKDAKIYADSASIKRTENRVRLWVKSNYSSPILNVNFSRLANSSLNQVEIDCESEKWALSYISYYSEPDGKGDAVWSKTVLSTELNFNSAPPGTLGSTYVSAGCNR
jgi:hypothetical protein